MVGMCRPGRRHDLLVGRVQSAVSNVLHDGALEQPCVLQYHAEALAQAGAVEIAHIVSIQPNRPAVDIIKAHEQLDHRGLSRTGRADNRHHLSRPDIAGEVMDDRSCRVIAEAHMVELDISANVCNGCRMLGGLLLLFLLEKFKDALGCRRHRLQHIGHLCELGNRLCEIADILDKRLNVADGNHTRDRQHRAGDSNADITKIADKVHHRLHQSGQKLGFPRRFIQFFVGIAEHVAHAPLLVKRAHDAVSGKCLLNLTVDLAEKFLLRAEVFLAEAHNEADKQQRDRQNGKRNQRHQRADCQHHDQHADNRCHRGNQLRHALIEALSHRVHIICDAGKHLADRPALEIAQRHAVDFFTDLTPHAEADFLRDAGHNPALHECKGGTQHIHAEQQQKNPADAGKINRARAGQLRNQSLKQNRDRLTQDFRAGDVEHRTADGKNQHRKQTDAIAADIAQQPAQRPPEIFRFFPCHPVRSAPHARSCVLTHLAPPPSSSLSLSWLSAISR